MTPLTKVFSEYVDARETVKTRFCFCRMYSDIFSSVAKDAELCYNLSVNTEEKTMKKKKDEVDNASGYFKSRYFTRKYLYIIY